MKLRVPRGLALGLLLTVLPASARAGEPSRFDLVEERPGPPGLFAFGAYDSQKGLRNLATTHVAQDLQGYLWVSSEDGLYRYNAHRFRRFDRADGLPLSNVTALLVTTAGTVWAGTLGGLARKEADRFVPAPGLTGSRVNALAEGPDGTVYAANGEGVFVAVAGQAFRPVPGWPGGPAHALWVDAEGLMASQGPRLFTLAAGSVLSQAELSGTGEAATSVVRDGASVLWALAGRQVFVRPPGAAGFAPWSAQLPPIVDRAHLSLDRKGRMWVPTTRGLFVALGAGASPGATRWRQFGPRQGFPDVPATGVFEDREGTLWIAGMGLQRLLGQGQWQSHDSRNGFLSSTARTVFRDREGTLWVGTDAGLLRTTGEDWRLVPGTDGRPIRTVCEGPDGTLLVGGSPVELGQLDPKTLAITWFGESSGFAPALERILALQPSPDGSLWVATAGGLLRAPARRPFTAERVPLPGGKADERISDLVLDPRGRLWAAGERGLAVLEDGRWRRLTTADGLRHDYLVYLGLRRSGEVCAAYRESLGVSCVALGEPVKVTHLDATQGLSPGRVYALAEDTGGNLWLGTGMGVDVVGARGVRHFGLRDGLPGEDTSSRGLFVDVNGDVWLSTSSGLGRFTGPAFGDEPPPPTILESVRLGGRAFPLGAAVTLPRAQNTLEVEFAGLSFSGEAALEHEIRLVGLEDWHAVEGRSARYPALPPGEYRFEARARHPSGEWGSTGRFTFAIEAAWWETLWARVLAGLLGLALVGLGAWWRARVFSRRNRLLSERNRAQARTLAALRQARERIGALTTDLRGQAERMHATAAHQHAASTEQAQALAAASTSVRLVADSSRTAADRARTVLARAEQSQELSASGRRDVEDAIQAVEKVDAQTSRTTARIGALDERSERIGAIVDSVTELAETTSMLALNASLEAARASEHGRGFLVIAQEMQRLAAQSKAAATQVRAILEDVTKETRLALAETEAGRAQTREGRAHVLRAGETIGQLSALIGEFATTAREIATDSERQRVGVEQILETVNGFGEGMERALQAVRDIEAASAGLATQSQQLTLELEDRPAD